MIIFGLTIIAEFPTTAKDACVVNFSSLPVAYCYGIIILHYTYVRVLRR